MNTRVTVRDLAAKVGVSHTTVSLALRGDPRILPETRRRVVRAARAAGYRPDAVLSTLMAHLSQIRVRPARATLGFITAWPTRNGWRENINHRRFHAGVLRRSEELGYSLDEFWLREPGMTADRMTGILRARGIRGLVFQSLPAPNGRLSLAWDHFACVTKGLTVAHPPLHRVVSSHYEDLRLVLCRLANHGYRRIGLVLGKTQSERVDQAWLAAFYVYQSEIEAVQRVPALLLPPDGERERLFRRWLHSSRPEALLFSDQPVLHWVERIKLNVPAEIGLVNLDWSPAHAPLSGLDSEPENIGIAAVDLLVGQLHAHEHGIPRHEKIVTVKGRWVPGSTIRRMTRRSLAIVR